MRYRKEDIPLLTNYYKDHFLNFYGKESRGITDDCIEMLKGKDWPGNVRQLKNVIERSVVLLSNGAKKIDSDRIRMKVSPNGNGYMSNQRNADNSIIEIPIGASLEEIEQKVISQTLDFVDNNKTEAAKILGFARKTLHNKLNKYSNVE